MWKVTNKKTGKSLIVKKKKIKQKGRGNRYA